MTWVTVEPGITERLPEGLVSRLNQGRWWRTKSGEWKLIADMSLDHRRNTAAMLLRNAAAYEFRYSLIEANALSGDLSENVEDGLMEALARRMEDPATWMRSMPLYQALMEGLPRGW